MRRALKILSWTLAGALLVLAAGTGAVLFGGNGLAAWLVEAPGSALLGHSVRLQNLVINWGRPIRVRADDVHIANADWGSAPDMFTAQRLDAEIDPAALLRLHLAIQRLDLEGPMFLLETSATGDSNWHNAGRKKSPRLSAPGRLSLHHGRWIRRDHRAGGTMEIELEDLRIEPADKADSLRIAANGLYEQQPFALTGEIGGPAWHRANAQLPYPVELRGRFGNNEVAVTGSVDEPLARPRLDLRIDLAGPELRRLLASLGVEMPHLPLRRLVGHLRREGARWTLEDATGRIGRSELAGGLIVEADERGQRGVRAELIATPLDPADLLRLFGVGIPDPGRPPSPTAPPNAKVDERVIPDKRWPIERLRGYTLDLAIDAPRVMPFAGLSLGRAFFAASVRDGTVTVKPLRVSLAGGEVSAEVEYRAGEALPRLQADVEARRLDLHRLLAGTRVSKALKESAGLAGGFAKLRSRGAGLRELLARSSGDIALFVERGQMNALLFDLLQVDIAGMLGWRGDHAAATTPINCLVSRFALQDGVATAETLLLDTREGLVTGEGNVNLADETLFLDLKPYPKHASPLRVRAPLQIRGTFARPQVAPDKVSLAARLGAALGAGALVLPGALLAFIDSGLGEQNACRPAFAAQRPAGEGSSTPPSRGR